jgi:hypothetical protein
MRVGVESEEAARANGAAGEVEVDVLASWIAVDFDGNSGLRRRREDGIPVGGQSRTRSVHAPSRMPEDAHGGRSHRSEQSRRLIGG